MTAPAVLPEAEPMSHVGSTRTGVLVIHGFTGNPSSMRGIAEAMVALGHHVEMPRLPGHGTTIDDMVTTGWADWTGEVAAAHERLADRVDEIVVVGLSMGGSLTLWSGFELSKIVGLACINPATTPQAASCARHDPGDGRRRHRDHARQSEVTSRTRTSRRAPTTVRRCGRCCRSCVRG